VDDDADGGGNSAAGCFGEGSKATQQTRCDWVGSCLSLPLPG